MQREVEARTVDEQQQQDGEPNEEMDQGPHAGSTPTGQAPQGSDNYQPGQGGKGGSGYQPGQSEMAGGTTSRPDSNIGTDASES